MREDYSQGGDAWDYFSHDQARSRAYRWGEDGIAGICDERQRLCLALALWNGADPILKERMFGLTNGEGNHGEDVKEYWFYLDSTPTHSYLKCQYKYPQRAFPYEDLVATNARRGKQDMEYELLDTGDLRRGPLLRRGRRVRQGRPRRHPHAASPRTTAARTRRRCTCSRRSGSATRGRGATTSRSPTLDGRRRRRRRAPSHPELGEWLLRADASAQLLFCENETNNERLFGAPNASAHVKDAINDFVVGGAARRGQPGRARAPRSPPTTCWRSRPGESASIRVRLTARARHAGDPLGAEFDAVLEARRGEADQFYATVIPPTLAPDAALVMRQALAGLLWGKQYYEYDVHRWLREHGVEPVGPERPRAAPVRNVPWFHMVAGDVISMPDKWEYPWFAAWDLAFHCAPLSLVDVDFAKEQVELLLQHALPAPERPDPGLRVELQRRQPARDGVGGAVRLRARGGDPRRGRPRSSSARVFERLLTNFTWWVNRKDPDDRNLFQGGFLGLDNIGIFDRSAPLPGGGTLEQADGTAWMALYCQWMLQIAVELAKHDPAYGDMALKFITHFEWIAIALDPPGGDPGLWDEEDGFYYDVMRMPDGTTIPLKVRSLVGLLPLCAATVFDARRDRAPTPSSWSGSRRSSAHFSDAVPALAHLPGPEPGGPAAALARRRAAAAADPRGDARRGGVPRPARDPRDLAPAPRTRRACSTGAASATRSRYLPAESDTGMFGGNSNWRGPVWFPMNLVILRGLLQLHRYYGDRLKVECPTGSGRRDEPAGGRASRSPAPDDDVHRGRARAPAGVRRDWRSSRPTRTGTTCCSSTSTSTATTAPASAPATRPAGRAPSRCSSRSPRR